MSVEQPIAEIEVGMLQMQILWLLGGEPTHGYDLMKKLTEIKGIEMTQGTLYPTLARLVSLNLIEVKNEGSRGKKIYQLTDAGRSIMTKTCKEFCKVFEGVFRDFVCSCCPDVERGLAVTVSTREEVDK